MKNLRLFRVVVVYKGEGYMSENFEEKNSFELPEETAEQIIDKISALAWDIREDWFDPKTECCEIVRLCELLIHDINKKCKCGDGENG